jgi:3-deoxy-D-manno-octulosonate 8-phosphate phosphatase (KDO 8-P phosphatase)
VSSRRATPGLGDDLLRIVRDLRAVCFDFDGVFTDNMVYVDQHGVESVRCWRGDGLGLSRLRKLGLKTLILSTEANAVVSVRAAKLQVECVQGVADKAAAIADWSRSIGVPLGHVAFVGNDINDVPALKEVGFPIGVADSHPSIDPYIKYRTRAHGGGGAVREVCDLIGDLLAEVKP